MKQDKIKKNEIYAYILEGLDEKGKELSLIAKDKLDEKGIANVYMEAKKLWDRGVVSKVHMFGITEKGDFYHGRPDQWNFEVSKIKYAKNLIKCWNKEEQLKHKDYIKHIIGVLDETYEIRLEDLLNGKSIRKTKIPKVAKKKEENER